MEPTNRDAPICADFETSNPAFIRDLLKTIETVVEEATFDITPEGIQLIAMDPSHVAMIEVFVPDLGFDRYHVEGDRRITFNVAEVLKLVFRKSVKDASLRISLEETRILFEIRDSLRRRKYAPILEPMEEEVPVPKIYFKAQVRILTEALKRIVEDFTVSEHINIEVSPDKVTFYADGDLGREEVTLERYDDPILDLDSQGPQKAIYTLTYLVDFIKKVKAISEVVNLELSEDMPIRITAELPISDARLIFYAAPCIGAREEPETEVTAPEEAPAESAAAEEPAEVSEEIPVEVHIEEAAEPEEVPEIPARAETTAPYVCEVCGAEIPEGKEIPLEDDTIVCYRHAPDDLLTPYWRYRKYLAEIEEQNLVEAAPTISGGDQ